MNSQMVVQDLSFSTLRTKENKKLIMMDLIAKWKKKKYLGLGREAGELLILDFSL